MLKRTRLEYPEQLNTLCPIPILDLHHYNMSCTEKDEASVIEIDPNGDTILELSGLNGKISLLVSSKVLTLASPVFSRMFNSRFKESSSKSSTSEIATIPLPDDNAEIFLILCNSVHHRVDEVPRKLDLDCLQNLAITCDKYDCTNTLTPWISMWFHAWSGSHTEKDLTKLLFAAYVLDIPDAFSRYSWEMLLVHDGPFISLPGVSDQGLITGNILGMSTKVQNCGG